MSTTPIADHALLSDCHSAALVDPPGSVDWLCFPRFDSPSMFGRLLDDAAGHWSIRPVGDADVSRGGTSSARWCWRRRSARRRAPSSSPTRSPSAAAIGATSSGTASPHLLLRQVTGVEGEVEVDVEFAPRPEYGLIHPAARSRSTAASPRAAAPTSLVLVLAVDLRRRRCDGRGAASSSRAGDRVGFALHHRSTQRGAAAGVVAGRDRRAARRHDRRPGGPGRRCTRATRGRGATSSTTAAGCCRP